MELKKKNDENDQELAAKLDEELAQMYEDSIVDIKEGQVVKGTIVQTSDKEILIDIGFKSEGSIFKSEIPDIDKFKVGDEIDVMLEAKENDMGMVVLSYEKAKRFKGWQNLQDNYSEGDMIEGKVFKKVRGGFMVDIGMGAFLPASLSMMQEFGGADNIVGETLEFKIVKINIPRKNIVLSRKEIVEEKRHGEKQAILGTLSKGDLIKGVVRNITDFGAFVDIGGGITGLLHITDMSWGRINHPGEVVNVGDEIEVTVLDFDKVSVKVSLGLKQKTTNPWQTIDEKFPEGSVITGKVVNIMPYGVFVELEKGIEGLVHISEFSWSKKFGHPSEKFQAGDMVEVMVLKVDRKNQKLSLGVKQLEKNPWEGVEERYNVGDRIKGKISAVTDYGAFVELEKGVEGLVHVSDLSWTKRVAHPREILKKDEEIEAIILNVDEQNRRVALGVKQLTQDPWDEISQKYKPDTVCEGKITNITNFGIFIELEKDLEGLLHVSEIDLKPSQKMEDVYKMGDVLKVSIMHIDGVQKKIALSNKGLQKETQDGQQETSGEQEITSDEQQETSGEQQATSDKETSDEKTSDERRETSDDKETTSSEQQETSGEQEATSDERQATSDDNPGREENQEEKKQD